MAPGETETAAGVMAGEYEREPEVVGDSFFTLPRRGRLTVTRTALMHRVFRAGGPI
jgi:hypothetical protein